VRLQGALEFPRIYNIRGEVISKRIAQLCILESLYINVLLKPKEKIIENLEKSGLAVELNKL
jgi:DNA-binding MurR/RpiR family transcriptional regulator